MDADVPEWLRGLTEAFGEGLSEGFSKAFAEVEKLAEQAEPIIAAQGAMGWMVRGDLDQARDALDDLPAEQLQAVSVAAAAVSSLADEIAAGKENAG